MYRILLVDDEMPALRFLQAIVAKYAPDFRVCASYTNGTSALEYLRKYPVDLLITDISMDGMNGIELAQAARLQRIATEIIIEAVKYDYMPLLHDMLRWQGLDAGYSRRPFHNYADAELSGFKAKLRAIKERYGAAKGEVYLLDAI